MLTIQNFSKQYSDTIILSFDRVDFAKGIYWIQGENGSGKTTFFRAIAGLHPCKAEMNFSDGTNLHKHPVEFRRRVNYSEAEPLYPGFLTPKDLIRFVGRTKGASLEQQEKYTHRFGVSSFFEKPVETFSSGMLKKVSLVLAFLGHPKVIILDEPLITLDARARTILTETIAEYLKENEATFLLSSHQAIETPLLTIQGTYRIENKTMTAS